MWWKHRVPNRCWLSRPELLLTYLSNQIPYDSGFTLIPWTGQEFLPHRGSNHRRITHYELKAIRVATAVLTSFTLNTRVIVDIIYDVISISFSRPCRDCILPLEVFVLQGDYLKDVLICMHYAHCLALHDPCDYIMYTFVPGLTLFWFGIRANLVKLSSSKANIS